MDELLNEMTIHFKSKLQLVMLDAIKQVSDEKMIYPLELTKKQVSEMLGVSTQTFDERFHYKKGFPVLDNVGKREKYPRDAVIEWYQKNWDKS